MHTPDMVPRTTRTLVHQTIWAVSTNRRYSDRVTSEELTGAAAVPWMTLRGRLIGERRRGCHGRRVLRARALASELGAGGVPRWKSVALHTLAI